MQAGTVGMSHRKASFGLFVVLLGLIGCGTTRMTDTTRAASEMLLVSQAVDRAVESLDFSELQGKTVFLEVQYLDGTVDKGYLISSIREHLLAYGALIQEERGKATYVVEPRSGAVGTDKYSLLVGTPAMSLPAVVPGVPSAIPEIALVKRTDQKGVAKLSVFAYNRTTGRALWQTGPHEAISTLKDTWFFGAGPYSRGTIRREGEFAGESIPKIPQVFRVFPEDPEPPQHTRMPIQGGEGKKPVEAPAPLPFGSGLFGFERSLFPTMRATGATELPSIVIPKPTVEEAKPTTPTGR